MKSMVGRVHRFKKKQKTKLVLVNYSSYYNIKSPTFSFLEEYRGCLKELIILNRN